MTESADYGKSSLGGRVRPPFPSVIDSSLISAARSCGRKVELEYFLHFKPRTPNVHLHAGKSFARGLEVVRESFYVEGKSPQDSIADGLRALLVEYGDFECPEDSAKSCARMMGALEYYFSVWPLGEDKAVPHLLPSGARAIEFNFLEPLDFAHPETGEPLFYSGRFDQIVDYAGAIFGEDDKTASSLGASWGRQWDLHPQFTAYCWGAAKGGLPLEGFLVRGCSILKTKYDHQQAITYRPAWRIDRWYEQLLRDLKTLVESWDSGHFDYNEGHSCNEYGGCLFQSVCQSKDPEPFLEAGFVRRRWDPVLRIEELL